MQLLTTPPMPIQKPDLELISALRRALDQRACATVPTPE